ncbi:MAG: apolipoprotein N-acyltransferase [Spirochaetales bacterium]|nr:apolipoprotein N-acyltransferase [Spirochaetales bacterium]
MTLPTALFMTVLSAGLLVLSIPNELMPLGSFSIGLIALAPLYLALLGNKGKSRAGLMGGLLMLLVHLGSSFWLAYFKEFAIFTLGASALGCFLIGVPAGFVFRSSIKIRRPLRPFLFAAAWTVWEWGKSIGFLAYPWGTVSMSAHRALIPAQIAEITGTWGISYLMALFSAVFAECVFSVASGSIRNDLKRSAPLFKTLAFSAFLWGAALCFGSYRLVAPRSPSGTLAVTLVQQNADSWADGGAKKAMETSQRLTGESIAAAGKKPDLIVWSESTLPFPFAEYRNRFKRFPESYPFLDFLKDTDVPLLVGAPVVVDEENWGLSNSAVLISPEGVVTDWHAKVQLVPFAEYMPFTEYEWVRNFFDALVGFSRGWVPGTKIKSLVLHTENAGTVRFAAPICFEDAFSSLVADFHNTGSNLLINMTNDSWSKTDSAEYQHHAAALFRAIELRTTLIRSTNAGYSTVINAEGRILADMPLFAEAAITVDAPLYQNRTTFYARFGNWLPALLALALIFVFIFVPETRKRTVLLEK